MLALIDVEPGFRMMSNVVEVDPEAVRVGMPVRVTSSPRRRVGIPLFVPAASGTRNRKRSSAGSPNPTCSRRRSSRPADLMAQASLRALADAGLAKRDVDGVLSASAYYYMPT